MCVILAGMSSIKYDQRVAVGQERAFEVFTDFEKASEMIEDILAVEPITEGPVREGYRFKETRRMGRKSATETFEVVEMARPERLVLRAESCGTRFEALYTFRPEGDGTVLHFEMTIQPRTLGAKLMSPMWLLMRKPMRKAIAGDLGTLAAVAEGRAPSGGAGEAGGGPAEISAG